MTRVANMCPYISHLEMSNMNYLTEQGRLSIFSLFRQIVQNSPPIKELNMEHFSEDKDRDVNVCELLLESLLSSTIVSIISLNLSYNSSWFKHTVEDRSGNIDLLGEIIAKQAWLNELVFRSN